MDSSPNKQPQEISRGRNETSGGDRSRVVAVPLVAEPVVVHVPVLAIPVEVVDVHLVVHRVAESREVPSITPSFDYSED